MVGQVVIDRSWADRSRTDEGERGERVRVIERSDLGHHPTDADTGKVCRPVIEFAGECRCVT
ncbi:hypothetical protein [Ruania halotolerans]|uniref:hypothetical protein n=1 Tax=Ruania halotolerans TaxID=2897773 RepID=UPI001E33D65C|nr:hypothetical protein [Ruania halotolerans]UFU06343.1 hypothetical protein LQF10_18275 [Ruania halotolerans]